MGASLLALTKSILFITYTLKAFIVHVFRVKNINYIYHIKFPVTIFWLKSELNSSFSHDPHIIHTTYG